ncbi:hypothetical protein AB9F41_35920, partial [Rhizobium leguminosarum]|uniref:hypothetical protein n=1 Tax=Rhizobium leguminosarum TaxID=384 RepID=UPI003F94AA16
KYLNLNVKSRDNYDANFFEKWKFVKRDSFSFADLLPNIPTIKYKPEYILLSNITSDVTVFENEENIVVAYRGTDQFFEKIADLG